MVTEGQHESYVIAQTDNGGNAIPNPFSTPLDFREVYSLAAPFFESCPTNASLPITPFPTLTLSGGNGTYSPGDRATPPRPTRLLPRATTLPTLPSSRALAVPSSSRSTATRVRFSFLATLPVAGSTLLSPTRTRPFRTTPLSLVLLRVMSTFRSLGHLRLPLPAPPAAVAVVLTPPRPRPTAA